LLFYFVFVLQLRNSRSCRGKYCTFFVCQ